jgi:hypothetical protein
MLVLSCDHQAARLMSVKLLKSRLGFPSSWSALLQHLVDVAILIASMLPYNLSIGLTDYLDQGNAMSNFNINLHECYSNEATIIVQP